MSQRSNRVDTSLIIDSRMRSSSQSTPLEIMEMDEDKFKLLSKANLIDPDYCAALQAAIQPLFKSNDAQMKALTKSNTDLLAKLDARDKEIVSLKNKVVVLEDRIDDMEQWTRKGSARIQGLKDSPSESNASLDRKILDMCTEIGVEPPVEIQDIEVAHRLPHPKALLQKLAQEDADARGVPLGQLPDGSQTTDLIKLIPADKLPPRSVIVKFSSRRVKSHVMAARKKLKNLNKVKYPTPVFLQDDLTQRRAKLAYLGRKLVQQKKIEDTWVFDSKILIKDLHNRIRPIRNIKDLAIYGIMDDT